MGQEEIIGRSGRGLKMAHVQRLESESHSKMNSLINNLSNYYPH